MKKFGILICLLSMAFALFAAAPVCAEPWTMSEFMIAAWGSPGDEAMAAAYRDAHFNTVQTSADKLEMCGKYGLKGIVRGAAPEFAAANKDNPNVWGWFVRDEPKEDEYESTAVPVAALHAADPNHPAYVNMVSSYDVDSYAQIVNPRIMSFDYYQWWWGPSFQFFFLDKYRRAALTRKVPLLVWVEVNADPLWEYGKPGAGYPRDNEPKLRQSVFTALAYGAKGIQWFVESLIFVRTPENTLSPELSPAGEDVKTINADLEAIGPELIKLESTGVFHTSPPVYEKEPCPTKDRWVKAKGTNLTIGMFKDRSGGRYVMVVNRDITKQNTAHLKFDGQVSRVSRFDRRQRRWVEESKKNTISVALNTGDGELLKIE